MTWTEWFRETIPGILLLAMIGSGLTWVAARALSKAKNPAKWFLYRQFAPQAYVLFTLQETKDAFLATIFVNSLILRFAVRLPAGLLVAFGASAVLRYLGASDATARVAGWVLSGAAGGAAILPLALLATLYDQEIKPLESEGRERWRNIEARERAAEQQQVP